MCRDARESISIRSPRARPHGMRQLRSGRNTAARATLPIRPIENIIDRTSRVVGRAGRHEPPRSAPKGVRRLAGCCPAPRLGPPERWGIGLVLSASRQVPASARGPARRGGAHRPASLSSGFSASSRISRAISGKWEPFSRRLGRRGARLIGPHRPAPSTFANGFAKKPPHGVRSSQT